MSNCNSDGCPIDHDGMCLEDDCFSSVVAPFTVSADVLRELKAGHGLDSCGSHLEADAQLEVRLCASSSGGIPFVEQAARVADASQPGGTTIEDLVELDDGYSRGEPPSPNTAANLCRSNTSASIHAMLRVSKQEREELISTRRKLMDVLNFMKQKGYSEEQMLADLVDDGFLRPLCERDDYGLPDLGSKLRSSTDIPAKKDPVDQVLDKSPELNPFTDKMKAKVPGDVPEGLAQGHLDSSPPPQVPVVNKPVQDKPKLGEKSWSQVLNGSTSKAPPISFDFIKESVGVKKISPPKEVLQRGNERFKFCLVGSFSKGHLTYAKVAAFAHQFWASKGLIHVSQKDSHTFIFKFKEENDMNSILAKGTWFIERRPMILHC